ncbi:hypothetical protein JTE90_007137 [Oedothorax gibbosus]|uniref:Uncharacterized protein n=1 Tax=Oedothorax gibbosus TaxID=931172 RepID=A0AAV6VQP8_9ARAC|nr:hypothetical protein JTE90_007137 [Oedothorax gibbosus]
MVIGVSLRGGWGGKTTLIGMNLAMQPRPWSHFTSFEVDGSSATFNRIAAEIRPRADGEALACYDSFSVLPSFRRRDATEQSYYLGEGSLTKSILIREQG